MPSTNPMDRRHCILVPLLVRLHRRHTPQVRSISQSGPRRLHRPPHPRRLSSRLGRLRPRLRRRRNHHRHSSRLEPNTRPRRRLPYRTSPLLSSRLTPLRLRLRPRLSALSRRRLLHLCCVNVFIGQYRTQHLLDDPRLLTRLTRLIRYPAPHTADTTRIHGRHPPVTPAGIRTRARVTNFSNLLLTVPNISNFIFN